MVERDAFRLPGPSRCRGAVNHQVAAIPVEGRAAIREMFAREFATAQMTCIPEVIHEAGDVAILEGVIRSACADADSSRFATTTSPSSAGYWDKLSLLRAHSLPIPTE